MLVVELPPLGIVALAVFQILLIVLAWTLGSATEAGRIARLARAMDAQRQAAGSDAAEPRPVVTVSVSDHLRAIGARPGVPEVEGGRS